MPYLELDVLNNAPAPIVGIDLGTTNSLVAVWRDDRPAVLKPEGKSGRIPSAVHFPTTGPPIVGQKARAHALTDPSSTILSIKRFMGRGLKDVAEDLETLPFPSSETDNGLLQFDVRGRKYSPQELSALILRHIREVASELLDGANVFRAVITVPAYFDDTQRAATRDAAKLAGLDVERIINEPTAASLAYGLDQRKDGTVAVYDLGGGTFDVSILSIEEGVFRVLATSGDTHLGGDDFDRVLIDHALERMGPEAVKAAADPAFRQGLKLSAEACKMKLSSAAKAEFQFASPDHGISWCELVTRDTFEELIAPLVNKTLDSCRRALKDAGLELDDVDEVVLVGGSTRVPLVAKRVAEFFGSKPHTELDPDEVVALGAAVQGHVLSGGTREVLLLDVTPLSLGIETMGGAMSKIIARNSPIPGQATEGFTTYADNQTGIDFNVLQGERELAADCRSLGRFKLSGIPPMPAGMARVGVRFALDANGILTVTAKEETTGQSASIDVQPMHGLTDDEVEVMLSESYEHAQADFDARRVADLRTEIGTMIRATERALGQAGEALDRETRTDIEEAVAEARRQSETGGLDEVQGARDHLEQATLPLAALLMDGVAKTALTGKKMGDV